MLAYVSGLEGIVVASPYPPPCGSRLGKKGEQRIDFDVELWILGEIYIIDPSVGYCDGWEDVGLWVKEDVKARTSL